MKVYPKIGDVFYWKDCDNEIIESKCIDIEYDDNPDIATLYFISRIKNGAGTFVDEDSIIDSNSQEVKDFKIKKAVSKYNKIVELMQDEYVQNIICKNFEKFYDADEIYGIIKTFTNGTEF
jgi:hypothetical protein